MNGQYLTRRLLYGIPLVLGVTFISFLLMVYFGPDKTYELVGKNPTAEQIAEVRHALGYDRPFLLRYGDYLGELITLDLGLSDSTGEPVSSILKRTLPISIALVVPGFILGNLLGLALGLLAAWYRGKWLDKLVMSASVVGMSVSFLVIIIGSADSVVYTLWSQFVSGTWLAGSRPRILLLLRNRTHTGTGAGNTGLQHALLPGDHGG